MKNDPVSHPSHYAAVARVECIEIIEDLGLGFNLGNALKYIWRKGKKDPSKTREDLEKARFYIDREIALMGGPSWNPTLKAPSPRKEEKIQ